VLALRPDPQLPRGQENSRDRNRGNRRRDPTTKLDRVRRVQRSRFGIWRTGNQQRVLELGEGDVLIETHRLRVRAHFGAPVHPVGNDRQIAVLERLEMAPGNLRLVGDVAKSQTSPLARIAQELAEVRNTKVVLQDRGHGAFPARRQALQEFCPNARQE